MAVATPTCDDSKILARPVPSECPHVRLDWTAFVVELYEARSLVFSGGLAMARKRLLALMHHATKSAAVAFECPSALASVGHALAEVFVAFGDGPRAALALIHTALVMLPIAAHYECSQWPLQGRDLASSFLQLAASVAGKPPLASASSAGVAVLGGPHRYALPLLRVALLTVCAAPRHRATELKAVIQENRRLYGSLHGYDVSVLEDAAALGELSASGVNLTASNLPPSWRAHAAQRVAESTASTDWLLWLDCDAVIVDPARSVQSMLAGYSAGSDHAPALIAAADRYGIRPDAWLLRLSAWGREFLNRWIEASRFSVAVSGGGVRKRRLSEREALRHAVLPEWEALLRGGPLVDWERVRWPAEVQLQTAGDLLGFRKVSDRPGDSATVGAVDRSFAWTDLSCSEHTAGRGRGALSDAEVELCTQQCMDAHVASVARLAAQEGDAPA